MDIVIFGGAFTGAALVIFPLLIVRRLVCILFEDVPRTYHGSIVSGSIGLGTAMGLTGIWWQSAWGFRLGMAGILLILTVLDQKLSFDRQHARMSWMRTIYGASLLERRHSAPAAGQQAAGPADGSAAQHGGGQNPLFGDGLQHGSGQQPPYDGNLPFLGVQQPPYAGLTAPYGGGQHPLFGGELMYGGQQPPFGGSLAAGIMQQPPYGGGQQVLCGEPQTALMAAAQAPGSSAHLTAAAANQDTPPTAACQASGNGRIAPAAEG